MVRHGGNRPRGDDRQTGEPGDAREPRSDASGDRDATALRSRLRRIDGRGYKAYREIEGRWRLPGFELHVDHVQADPFAAPSKLRVRVPMQAAGVPSDLFATPTRRVALCDALARGFERTLAGGGTGRDDPGSGPSGSGRSGVVSIDAGGQTVLERSAVAITPDYVEARIEVGLPASGRRVLGRAAEALLVGRLDDVVSRSLYFEALDESALRSFVACVENQEAIRARLDALGLIAFVGDGALLPRRSGADERPMAAEQGVPFRSPESLAVDVPVPNPVRAGGQARTTLRGMGVPKGVSLIVGGGYHGKSTLLRAIAHGVHPHVPGDGREYVVSLRDAVKVRAEDGRSVEAVDISGFIGRLPSPGGSGRAPGTDAFTSADASGSTSQAANIAEAIEAGARALLLDEDTSATNFMIRDARMQALVAADHEPITPFLDRVRALYADHGVSSVLVMGGSGDYFDVADRVIEMREFEPRDVTAEARAIARARPTGRTAAAAKPLGPIRARMPVAETLAVASERGRRGKVTAKHRELIVYAGTPIDLRHVEQIADASQTRAIALALRAAAERFCGDRRACEAGEAPTLREVLDDLEAWLDAEGLDALGARLRPGSAGRHPGNLARPRRYEIAAALNRHRGVNLIPR